MNSLSSWSLDPKQHKLTEIYLEVAVGSSFTDVVFSFGQFGPQVMKNLLEIS